jgi:hypothetical protein
VEREGKRDMIHDNEHVAAFVGAAQQYCELIDMRSRFSKEDFIRECAVILPRLFSSAVTLPDFSDDASEVRLLKGMTGDQWNALFKDLGGKLGDDDRYWIVFDPYKEEAPVSTSLSDDLADIYRNVKTALQVYGKSAEDSRDAIWHWRFHFLHHWGQHCSSALHAIYWVLERIEDD